MSIVENLKWRYATKAFDPSKKVTEDDLQEILQTLVLTPSSFGLQPWHFLVIESQDIKDALLEHSWNQRQVVEASHHIVFTVPTSFGAPDVEKYIEEIAKQRGQDVAELEGYKGMMLGFFSRMSPEQIEIWAKNQVYIALGNLMTVLAVKGIDGCPMEGIVQAEYDKVLGLAEKGLKSVVACPIGYRSSEDKYASAAKVRYQQSTLVTRL